MSGTSPVRYFFLASPPRRYLTIVQIVAAVGGIGSDLFGAMDPGFVLSSILFLQLFACSTGYVTHGTRGHYDPVLTSGMARWKAALAHLAASAGPGLLAWIVFGTYAAIRGGPEGSLAFRPASLTFLALVSVVSWALTLRLPPLSGGVIWCFAMLAVAISSGGFRALATTLRTPEAMLESPLEALAIGLALPLFGLGVAWPEVLLAGFTAIALAVLLIGVLFISWRDLPLAEEE
jgi:hypothetical protein